MHLTFFGNYLMIVILSCIFTSLRQAEFISASHNLYNVILKQVQNDGLANTL